MATHLKGRYDEVLRSFKKCYRTRLGSIGTPAAEEQGLLEVVCKALEAEVKTEWGISRQDWVSFIEGDLRKGGKSIHSITRLAEPPPVGEVEVGGWVAARLAGAAGAGAGARRAAIAEQHSAASRRPAASRHRQGAACRPR